jgi:hypothetical protein
MGEIRKLHHAWNAFDREADPENLNQTDIIFRAMGV